jgi:hypothetical protein
VRDREAAERRAAAIRKYTPEMLRKKFPSCRYHRTAPPIIVHSPEEDAALGEGWADTPVRFKNPGKWCRRRGSRHADLPHVAADLASVKHPSRTLLHTAVGAGWAWFAARRHRLQESPAVRRRGAHSRRQFRRRPSQPIACLNGLYGKRRCCRASTPAPDTPAGRWFHPSRAC